MKFLGLFAAVFFPFLIFAQPTITSVTVPADGTYIAAQNLDFIINFSENITVNTGGGTPQMSIVIGATTRQAVFQSGSNGTTALIFRYTILAGELDTDGITIGMLSANGGSLQDAATNTNDADLTLNSVGSTSAVLVDAIAPSVTISSTSSNPTNLSPFPITITFSESVTGFDLADISVSNGTAGNFVAVSGTNYTADITPSAAGLVTVSVGANVATDAASNQNTASNTLNRTYDNTQPSVTITSAASNSTNVSPIPVTITFSESVSNFVLSDITITNGTAGGFVAVSGTIYTANITPTAEGAVTVSVAANVATDAAGNANTASTVLSRTYDITQPSVSITSVAPNPTNTSPIPVTITFSENVTGFVVGDISVTNGTAGGFVPVSGTIYTANITPTAAGLVSVSVAANVATDAASNQNTASNTLNRTYDNTQPSVTITSAASNSTNVSPIPVTITFSESVSNFVLSDITITNGTAGGFVAVSGTIYTANITPTAEGAVTVSVAANVATDAAGNANTASTVLSRTYDITQPSVSITSLTTNPTNASPIPVTITFSETVIGFVEGDISVTNGTTGAFVLVSGTTYTVNITPTAAGLVTVSVAANVATDAAANQNTASNTLNRTYDNTQPSVTITSAASNSTNVSPIPVTITFSESVSNFVLSDITITNGTAGGFVAVSGTIYTANITPTAEGTVTVSVAANVATDAGGNANTASTVLSRTYDITQPSVSITSLATNPTNASPIPVTITFSESVTGFAEGDISVTNGTTGTFVPVSGTTYTVNITPTTAGLVTVSVAANAAADAATNQNTASLVLNRTYDNIQPSVSITSSTTNPTNVSPIPVTITFSESVTGFAEGDISVTNGTTGAFVPVSGTTYTVNITPTAAGLVTVSVAANVAADAATNQNTVSNILNRTYDNSQPSVIISSTSTDPTNVSPFPVTITFSKSVTNFVLGDITVTNGTAGSFVAVNGATYTATITPGVAGLVSVSVAANVATDAASNGNTASNTLSRTFDNVQPSVTVSSTASEPTNASPIPVTITFSESVTNFVVSDITVTNGSAGSFAGSGTTYTTNITPSAAGLVSISVAANVATDAASNANTVSNTLSRTYDTSQPSVTITSTSSDPTNVSPIPVTITFSENVTGFDISDLSLSNGTAGSFAGSGTTYTVSITPTAAGLVTVNVGANVALDASSNGNTASNTLSRTYDTAQPSVIISTTSANPTKVSPIPVTITFSESVTGFDISDIGITNGSAGGFGGSGSTYTASITPTAVGLVTISIAANAAVDAATNGNTVSNLLSITYDNVPPTVVITTTATEPTNVSPIPVTLTFSESVTGFDVGDISLTNGTAGGFAGSGTTYTVNITPLATGLVTVNIAANVAVDAATNGNASSLAGFTYIPASTITSFTPTSAASGATVTITGMDFTGATMVAFGGTNAASFIVNSSTQITAVVGSGATGSVSVTTPAGTGSLAGFTLLPTPVISGYSPSALAVGATVVINGTDFSTIPANNVVTFFNGIIATVTTSTATTITTTVPSGAATGTVSLGLNGITVTGPSFTVLPTPTITALSPTSGAVGTVITITGSNFTSPATVTFYNGISASATLVSSTTITTTVPDGAVDGPISITTSGVTVNSSSFDVLASPTISGFSPGTGAAGAIVIITGTNFDGTPIVKFNGVSAVVTASTGTSITTSVPSGAATGPISVTTSGVTITSVSNFTVLPSPTISGFSPSSGSVGATVTITGTNFNTTPSNNTVTFNGTVSTVTSSTATSISTTVPAGASSGTISVATSGVTVTSSSSFTVLPSPSITGFSPSNGAVGAIITITGTNFSTIPSNNLITFNGVAAIVTGSSSTSITTTVPSGASTGLIELELNGITIASATNFNVLATPTIASFTPGNGAVGATVTITGTGFRASPQVTFNGTSATVTTSNATSIVTTVPSGASSGPISVTTAGITITSASNFIVLPTPTISGFNPSKGAVGAVITITGTNFTAPVVVKFNNVTSTLVALSSPTTLTATVPSGATDGPITVTTSGVTVSIGGFDVLATPTISNINPTGALPGSTVTITGTNFLTTPIVAFNGTAAIVTASTMTSITTSVPALAGSGPISVFVNGVTIYTSNFKVFGTPSITDFNPTNGAYSVVVTISGSDFSTVPSENTVEFNGTIATVTASTSTSITTSVPFGATTGPISVTVDGVKGTSSNNFVVPTPIITSFSPTQAAVGASVVITGSNFNSTPANNVVKFNGITATVSASSTTSITAVVPSGATTGKISVSVGGVTGTSTTDFDVLPTPTITTFSPAGGAITALVTITGTNFSPTPTDQIVKFSNNKTAIVSTSSATSIVTSVPTGAITGKISVTVSGITITSATNFTVLPTPTITSLNPVNGAVGATIIINGTNFDLTPSNNVVSFNGIPAVVSASSATSITVTVPTGAATGPISVTASGVTITSATNFTLLPTPTITDFTPKKGAVGATVTLTGTHYSSTPAKNVITFNGTSATVTGSTSTSITVMVPPGATNGKISLTLNGVTITSAEDFTVLPTPTITGFSPLSGAPGAIVIISGTNFSEIPSENVVRFSEVPALVTEATTTSLTTIVPIGSVTGKIDITVSGVIIISATNFIVMPSPLINSFNPSSAYEGDIVNITGLNFDSDEAKNVVAFNGVVADVPEAASTTAIAVRVPEGATDGPISVTVNGVTVYSFSPFTVLYVIPPDITPPLAFNNTPAEINQGSDLVISVRFEDPETAIISALVTVRSPSSGTEIFTSLIKNGENYEFTVPALLIGELGVLYQFTATNEKLLTYTSTQLTVRIRIPGAGLTIPYNNFGNNIANYRIIGIPLELDKPAVSDVFDELPGLDKTQWRISHYDNATKSNKDLTATSPILPGMGYWLLIKDNPLKPITTGTGLTVSPQPPFSVSLKAGWNQIGNPYNFNILWSDLVAANPGLSLSFRGYNGSIKNFENKTVMSIMEGGFVNVLTDMQLVFPTRKNIGGRVTAQQSKLENSIDQDEWEVDFTVQQGDMANVISGVGMRLDASENFDIYDGFSMPRFSEYLDVNHDKELNQYHYSKDIIPTQKNHTWNFQIDASSDNLTSISWDNSYLGLNDFNLILFDEQTKIWVDMKQHHTYNFTPPTNFKVLYGQEDYVKNEIGLGNARILEISPNPSNGPINIHLFLPEWQTKFPVQLELKSLTGITLANIYSGELESGYQKFEWSGENNSNPLPAGVYLIQMRCNNTIQTVRVILMN